MFNAVITSWKRVIGEKGDSLPILSDELLVVGANARPPIPCRLAAPSEWRRASARAEMIELQWLIEAPREPFRQIDAEDGRTDRLPEPGDRMSVKKNRSLSPVEAFEVVSVVDKGATLVIGFGKKLDGAA